MGYVSQFLRAIPRVSALDVVAEPALARVPQEAARERAAALLARLNLPGRLWSLPPATFSGGEQQRVNIARGFIGGHPILLLDEPTASLDADNRAVVVELMRETLAEGAARSASSTTRRCATPSPHGCCRCARRRAKRWCPPPPPPPPGPPERPPGPLPMEPNMPPIYLTHAHLMLPDGNWPTAPC